MEGDTTKAAKSQPSGLSFGWFFTKHFYLSLIPYENKAHFKTDFSRTSQKTNHSVDIWLL